MLRSIIVVIFLAAYILLLGPPFILQCIVTGSPRWLYFIGISCAKLGLRLGGVRTRVSGLENIPAGVCLFVANHCSNADPPAVAGSIPRRVALLAKKEVFAIPILSRALRLANFVPVDRSNRAAAIASVDQATATLKQGVSFLVYPEGTRSADGRLQPFKKGSFVMAINAGVPIVPIAVGGAHRIMRKGEHSLHSGVIEVTFLPPVTAAEYTLEQRDELAERVRDAIAAALPEDQRPA